MYTWRNVKFLIQRADQIIMIMGVWKFCGEALRTMEDRDGGKAFQSEGIAWAYLETKERRCVNQVGQKTLSTYNWVPSPSLGSQPV